MPISYKHKFKFIHIPKTAGSSIEAAFDLHHKNNLFVPKFTHKIENVNFSPQHFTHSLINVFKPEASDWFSFTIVRHPITKLISEYFYINKSFNNKNILNFNETEFVNWVKTDLSKFDMDHKLPQYSFIDIDVDFIMKFENLNDDFIGLNKLLGTNFSLLHTNTKNLFNKNKIADSLTLETKELIFDIFKEDFNKFGYQINYI